MRSLQCTAAPPGPLRLAARRQDSVLPVSGAIRALYSGTLIQRVVTPGRPGCMSQLPAEPSSASLMSNLALVVDDEPTVRMVVKRMLAEAGFGSLEAHCGEAALGVLETAVLQIDLVITDVIMPGLDGCELGRQIKLRWPATSILYASAYTPEELFLQGICTDDLPFVRKPFTADELIRRVREIRAA